MATVILATRNGRIISAHSNARNLQLILAPLDDLEAEPDQAATIDDVMGIVVPRAGQLEVNQAAFPFQVY